MLWPIVESKDISPNPHVTKKCFLTNPQPCHSINLVKVIQIEQNIPDSFVENDDILQEKQHHMLKPKS